MFPHTVTLYNSIYDRVNSVNDLYVTVLSGVLMQASKAVNVRESGLEGADAVNLYIPFGVTAVDGMTGKTKKYVGPQEFLSAEDRSNLWTLSFSGHGGTSFFVKGKFVTADEGVAQAQDNCYTVTKVDTKDYGEMQHWQVGGV